MTVQPSTPGASDRSEETRARGPHGATKTHLAGRPLVLARVAWAALAGLLLGLYALLLPPYWTHLRTVCGNAACAVVQPSPASARTLQQLGVSVADYATWTFLVAIASTL
ncbi:MAG TPA: hypothetical protein VGP82_09770, partial [Ktedonobacterales bacterium]|nr:hypothetical protein [Ktedonobacterales bacterium]